MQITLRRCAPVLLLAAVTSVAVLEGQRGGAGSRYPPDQEASPNSPPDPKLPNGKSQRDEILKAEHQQNLKDAAQLVEMAQQLQLDLEKNDRFVLSMSTLKKTDDIEKLVKKIRSRLRRE